MPLPSIYRANAPQGTATATSVLPIFQGASTTYSADEFLKRFNDLSNRAELTGEEKFAKVFEYIDSSLEGVMGIIRTCAYNDWATFERMFRTAYYTESQGLGYVNHIIKTFKDETPGFGIHIFLECFFAYTATLCKQGIMSPSQRFSMLTFSLPPTYIPFLRTYSSEARQWLSGMPSEVPTDPELWDRLISLTKQYAVDQQIFRNERRNERNTELKRRSAQKLTNIDRHAIEARKNTEVSHATTGAEHGHPYVAKCDQCGSQLPHFEANSIEGAFFKAAHDTQNNSNRQVRRSVASATSSVPSPSILSTPSEYLYPQSTGASGPGASQTSAEAAKSYTLQMNRGGMAPLPPPHTPPEKDGSEEQTPTPEKQLNAQQSISSRSRTTTTDSSVPPYTDTDDTNSDTHETSPVSPKDSLNFSSSDLITQYTNSNRDLSQYASRQEIVLSAPPKNGIRDKEFTTPTRGEFSSPTRGELSSPGQGRFSPPGKGEFPSPGRGDIATPTREAFAPTEGIVRSSTDKSSSTDNSATKNSKKKYDLGDKERRVWELFLRANQKVRPPPPSNGSKTNQFDDNMPDEDIFDIDELIAEQLDDDDSSSVSSECSVESFRPEIPVDSIMSQFADPELTKEREEKLVARYADVLTCYKMAEFVAYPEELLKHVFEIVLRYTYSTLEE